MGIPIITTLERFYKHRADGHEVFAICECVDKHVYFRPMDWIGDREKMWSQQFYAEYERIRD